MAFISVLGGLEFASLGSGSKGNSTVIRSATTTLLVDCGFSRRKTIELLARRGIQPEHLDAVLVTHEHRDHGKGVSLLSEKFRIPIYTSRGTGDALSLSREFAVPIKDGSKFSVGDIQVHATGVPHDAVEPLQFVFSNHGYRFGLLTDCGHITPSMLDAYRACNALLLESNHDTEMLNYGPYPPMLKDRVGGLYGHLSNAQSREFLKSVMHAGLGTVAIGHISEKNNDLQLLKSEFATFANQCEIVWANQETGTGWLR